MLKDKDIKERQPKRLKTNMKTRSKFRKKQNELKAQLGILRPGPGRPRVEDIVPEIPQLLLKIIKHKCVADPRRRSEILRNLGTISQVTENLNAELQKIPELKMKGFSVSRSTTYIRFMPRLANSYEGRRHPHCPPVRSVRALFNPRTEHVSLR